MKKQRFTILLVLLISMISTKAFADATGKCGDNLTWTFVEATQTLTISGNGAMYDYNYSNHSPWYKYNVIIKKAVINGGVTSIGDDAFFGCSGLTSVTIPNSVTNVGEGAFSDCSGLTSVTIPNSVTSIGNYAFYDCSGLTSITIPNSVTNIGEFAFESCSSLTSVTIPNSVTNIGEGAFYGCSGLTSIKVESGNKKYDSRNNCNAIIETSTKTLILGCKNTTIPNSVTSIGKYAFSYCSGLTSVTIPNSVTSIGNNAFQACSGLASITIGNSVTSIGYAAFYGCFGLTSFTFPNSMTNIGFDAFHNCSGLTSVTIPNSVTSIGDRAFCGCSGLTSIKVEAGNKKYDSRNNCNAIIETSTKTLILGCKNTTIPNSVTSIGEFAFYSCSGLTSFTIPSSVTSIRDDAFFGCSGLTSIKVEAGNTKYDSRNNCNALIETSTNKLILGCTNTIIPNSVTSIGEFAFYSCSGLTSVTIPNSVTSIESSAFQGCSGLTSITIPTSVTNIGNCAFYNCSALTSVTVEMKTPLAIDYPTFSNRKNAILYIPYGCKAAYEAANCWNEFKEIVEMVEVTDISQMSNVIYVDPASGRAGDNVSIKVCMKNANIVTSYGFELVLPSGLSIATTNEGDFDGAVTKSTRHNGHTLTTNKLADNTYKVGVASLSSKALTDNNGLVLTIKAHVADNMALGDYPILIQNPLIVNTDGTKPAVQNTQSKITIEDYKKGDVDGDGVVDLADAVLVINHYVGKPVNKFVAKAADVDGDGVIDLADAVRIINFYVGKVQSLAPSINIDGLDPQ